MADKTTTNQSMASKALLEILQNTREIVQNTRDIISLLRNTRVNTDKQFSYDDMLRLIADRPMYKLTDRQIYYMVERKDNINYIMAVSGYSKDEIYKKYKKHKDSNVYR